MRVLANIAVVVALLAATSARASADRNAAAPVLVALAPPPGDDARRAVALGPSGEVFAPDGKGAWVRDQVITIADRIMAVGRNGGDVVVLGDGVLFRLASNGWTAIRIVQKGKAIVSSGVRAVAAVGKQIYALDRSAAGGPLKLAQAAAPILAIGAGRSIVVATERGLFRLEGAKLTPIKRAPRSVDRLIGDRWALIGSGAVDLRSGVTTPWPSGLTISVVSAGPADSLVAVGMLHGALELVTVAGTKVARAPLPDGFTGPAVGVSVDRSGRALVALRDGRMALRDKGGWTVSAVREALPAARPGAPPATSP